MTPFNHSSADFILSEITSILCTVISKQNEGMNHMILQQFIFRNTNEACSVY